MARLSLQQIKERRAVLNHEALFSPTMTDKDDILLNSREVAFLLDLSPDTVNEFARRNILPAFKKGRQWRFRKRDITSFKRHMRGINAAA
jgi:excisionase family DNA binding protein